MSNMVFLLKGIVAPALAALVVALLLKRLAGSSRGVGAAAYAAGELLGIVLTNSGTGDWIPSRNFAWVPWMGVVAAALGPTVVATGLAAIERWFLTICAATVAAVVLVPQWPDLWPPRLVSIVLFALATTIVSRLMDGLARRTSPRFLAFCMAGVSLLAAMLIAASFSLSLGERALATAAAFSGTAAALSFRTDELAVRGLCLPWTLAVGGWCYVTAIEPSPPAPPLVALLFLPLALLVLWIAAIGPVSHWTARARLLASILMLALTLAGISAWAWFGGEHGGDSSSQSDIGADFLVLQ